MVTRLFVLLVLNLCCSFSHADEVVEIPLNEVWAYEMPGTKDVRELEPEVYGNEVRSLPPQERSERFNNSIIQQIRSSLKRQAYSEVVPEVRREPKQAFVVDGQASDALRGAFAVLSEAEKPQKAFTVHDRLSLVFYSMQSSVYIHLTDVMLDGNQIEVHFKFVPHFTDEMSSHFALIPLPDLKIGQYQVTIVEDPMKDYKMWGVDELNPLWREKYVCKDFGFEID